MSIAGRTYDARALAAGRFKSVFLSYMPVRATTAARSLGRESTWRRASCRASDCRQIACAAGTPPRSHQIAARRGALSLSLSLSRKREYSSSGAHSLLGVGIYTRGAAAAAAAGRALSLESCNIEKERERERERERRFPAADTRADRVEEPGVFSRMG